MEESKLSLLLDSLDAGVTLFKQNTSTATELPNRNQLKALLDKVRADSSKIGIMCGDGPGPSAQEAEGLSECLVQSCLALASLLHCLTSGAGSSLKAVVEAAASGVLGPAKELLTALAARDAAAVKREVGHVWGALDACAKAPIDNKSCLFKHFTTILLALKDNIREMTELEEEGGSCLEAVEEEEAEEDDGAGGHAQPSANGHGNATSNGSCHSVGSGRNPASSGNGTAGSTAAGTGGTDGDEHEDVVDFQASALGSGEAQVVAAVKQLVEAGGKALRAVSKPLLTGPPVTPDNSLEAWENVLWHARMLQRCCEDLGASMYPPQDLEEMQGAAEGLYNSAGLILQEIPEAYAAQLSAEASDLESQLEAAWQRLTATLQAAERADD